MTTLEFIQKFLLRSLYQSRNLQPFPWEDLFWYFLMQIYKTELN